MKNTTLYALWGGMFIVCAALGFIPEPQGALSTALTILSVLFFAPPALLLYTAIKRSDKDTITLVRNLSLLSLAATLILLIANFSLALSSETLGTILHYILTIVSAPMVTSQNWALSLFLWACLLMVSLRKPKK